MRRTGGLILVSVTVLLWPLLACAAFEVTLAHGAGAITDVHGGAGAKAAEGASLDEVKRVADKTGTDIDAVEPAALQIEGWPPGGEAEAHGPDMGVSKGAAAKGRARQQGGLFDSEAPAKPKRGGGHDASLGTPQALAEEQRRSERLKTQFDDNERQLEELNETLRIRIGDMGELFGVVRPDRAYFGEKDWQQLQLVRDMAAAFFLDVEVLPCPVVREADGLAMSSRNVRLSEEERRRAPEFHRLLASGRPEGDIRSALEAAGFGVDYVERRGGRVLGAVRLGNVRLIDNVKA